MFWLVFLVSVVSVAEDWPDREGRMTQVVQWARFEAQFTSSADYGNPVQDVQFEVDFTAPSGRKQTIPGFWDGGRTWKVRFSPDETGKWTYRSRCSLEADAGLSNRAGEFNCIPYSGDNPLYRHGTVSLSENRRYLIYSDGTPFFWLSDTAWNGALLSDEEDWEAYLKDRVAKGFTAIQFVTTQWRAATGDADGRLAFTGKDRIQINPVFYQRMDQRINTLNDFGLVAAPVLLWTCTSVDPGLTLPDDQLIALARYMVARYGSHHVIWILGGDGNYKGERAERWRKIGRVAFGSHPSRLATMHPGGCSWVADEFRNEPWFSFNGYQSGHGDNADTLRWLCEGPPSRDWGKEPHHPVINLEPNYEAHRAYHSKRPHDAHAVRRAAYWSLLVSPPAGVTYGAHGIWSWQLEPGEPMDHKGTGIAPTWYEAMDLPGSTSMKHLKDLFSSVEWWKLLPAPELLVQQPGVGDPRRFVAVAKAEDDSWAMAYMPEGTTITLRTDLLKGRISARWFNPRTGEWSDSIGDEMGKEGSRIGDGKFTPADNNDWVLWIGASE